ncbi:phosphate-starvation-inducible PsiE family protein [Aquifex aeolicus]|uniref:Uncharacterized protein aq_293 n=1 Tax=Aquifex aeolicus (strain VF5) TaxID=224324 RepID=Y293_AQUAE|nr:phosphate-starvation-inducible PsiE family protein [Aquifex aeolicus]O66643.1 RecName: Full=Uncharacterized protein aq_293 [Aquifex aeolicus VF5]AAC06601.1 putative protein [Aquifex aeolicus VF5]
MNKLTLLLKFLIQAFMWFAIASEFVSLLYEIFHSLKENYFLGLETHKILVKVLNVIIIYELFTTLLIALEERRIKLILIIDTAMIFFIRELLIVLFTYKKLELSEGIASALILGTLGILRFLYLKYKIDVE